MNILELSRFSSKKIKGIDFPFFLFRHNASLNIFPKGIDKSISVCYNKDTKRKGNDTYEICRYGCCRKSAGH